MMPIKLVHTSDIHFGSGEAHGKLNPDSGVNVRFEDFERALARVVDFCLDNGADTFLFSGDAYKSASPEPIYQQCFARQLKRLSRARIPAVLLVGNHDQTVKPGASHSMSVFQSLEVPALTVIERPGLFRIKTRHGKLQIIGMPHITRHMLMTHSKYAGYSSSEIRLVLVRLAGEILRDLYAQLDPDLPAVATAHMLIDTARTGAEKDLLLADPAVFPLDILIDSRLDYVGLGHVHRQQVLRAGDPLIVYAGSLERVDFGEENEDKGFVEVEIERGRVAHKFHSIGPRPFVTVQIDLRGSKNPGDELLKAALGHSKSGCILRLKYRVEQSQLSEIDEGRIKSSLPQLLHLRFLPEVVSSERPRRIPDINETAVFEPLIALEKFLSNQAEKNSEALLARARAIVAESRLKEKN